MKGTSGDLEDSYAKDIGLWEIGIDFFDIIPGCEALTLFVVDKGSYFIHGIRVIDNENVEASIRSNIKEILQTSPMVPKKLLFKKSSKFLSLCEEIADTQKVSHEVVSSFKTIPQIKRDIKNFSGREFSPDTESGIVSPYSSQEDSSELFNQGQDFIDTKTVPFTKNNFDSVYRFKISLTSSQPLIWRRIEVPRTYTFFELYIAIECAMGWAGGHLHEFSFKKEKTARRIYIKIPHPDFDDFGGAENMNELTEKIENFFGKIAKQCEYMYDFGDSWGHAVLFEGEFPRQKDVMYPICLAGKNACPPEDCGGLGGYDNVQHILGNKKHKEHKDMLEWLCIDDAHEFDLKHFALGEIFFDDPEERLEEMVHHGYFEA